MRELETWLTFPEVVGSMKTESGRVTRIFLVGGSKFGGSVVVEACLFWLFFGVREVLEALEIESSIL